MINYRTSENVQKTLALFDRCRCCMGCAQAKAAPGNQSDCHDSHRRLDEPRRPGCWGCRSRICRLIYTNNFAQKIGAAKKRGNNMKTLFLSSFCPSGFRSVIRFSPKNLVPEIINWLALVVRNCRKSSTK